MKNGASSLVVLSVFSCGLAVGQQWQQVATLASDADAGETLLIIDPICIPAEGEPFRMEAREGPLVEEGTIRYSYGLNLIVYRLLQNDFLAGSRIYQAAGAANCQPASPARRPGVQPLALTCEPARLELREDQATTLQAQASGGGGELDYSWMVDGDPVSADGASFRFAGAGSVGSHTISAQATSANGMTANCDFQVTVNPLANRPPTLRLALDREQVVAGETLRATGQASDPDNDPLSYSWSVDDRSQPETSSRLQVDTTGLAGGGHSVSLTVRDGREGSATQVRAFSVRERSTLRMKGTRVDNVAKAHLDEMALRMTQNPRLRALVAARTEGGQNEPASQQASQRAAENVRAYLTAERGVPAGRIETRPSGAPPGGEEDGWKDFQLSIEIDLFVP